jgi:hypothetical protein
MRFPVILSDSGVKVAVLFDMAFRRGRFSADSFWRLISSRKLRIYEMIHFDHVGERSENLFLGE